VSAAAHLYLDDRSSAAELGFVLWIYDRHYGRCNI
jgi:hypothetical protein